VKVFEKPMAAEEHERLFVRDCVQSVARTDQKDI
jgi:hypothetical protein